MRTEENRKWVSFVLALMTLVATLPAAVIILSDTNSADTTGTPIYTADELIAIGEDATTLGGNYYLADDIDLAGIGNFTPIGTSSDPFTGTFDGNGHVISGMTVNVVSVSSNSTTGPFAYAGLFGYVSNATIIDLGVVDSDVSASCSASNLYGSYYSYAGGIVGYVYGTGTTTLTNCYFSGSVVATGTSSQTIDSGYLYAGGIVGYVYNSYGSLTTIAGCHNSGSIGISPSSTSSTSGSYYAYLGGIAGYIASPGSSGGTGGSTTVTDCYNTGLIAASTASNVTISTYAGGIIGYTDVRYDSQIYIEGCYNTAAVSLSGVRDITAGGIVGRFNTVGPYSSTITQCYNTGPISASSTGTSGTGGYSAYAGGITGYAYAGNEDVTQYITDSYNTGSATASIASTPSAGNASYYRAAAGGISGYFGNSGSSSYLSNCYSIGTISATAVASNANSLAYAGGVVGYVDGRYTDLPDQMAITNCYFLEGQVTGKNSDNDAAFGYFYPIGATYTSEYYIDGSIDATQRTEQGTGAYSASEMSPSLADAQNGDSIYFIGTTTINGVSVDGWDFDDVWSIDTDGYPVLRALAIVETFTVTFPIDGTTYTVTVIGYVMDENGQVTVGYGSDLTFRVTMNSGYDQSSPEVGASYDGEWALTEDIIFNLDGHVYYLVYALWDSDWIPVIDPNDSADWLTGGPFANAADDSLYWFYISYGEYDPEVDVGGWLVGTGDSVREALFDALDAAEIYYDITSSGWINNINGLSMIYYFDDDFNITYIDWSTWEWTGDLTPVSLTDNGDGTYTISNITGDISVSIGDEYPLNTYTVTFPIDGTTYTVTVDGYIMDENGQVTVTHGSDLTFTITMNPGYEQSVPDVSFVDGYLITYDASSGEWVMTDDYIFNLDGHMYYILYTGWDIDWVTYDMDTWDNPNALSDWLTGGPFEDAVNGSLYLFYIDYGEYDPDVDVGGWLVGTGDNVTEAFMNALDAAGITYNLSGSGVINNINGISTIYYFDDDFNMVYIDWSTWEWTGTGTVGAIPAYGENGAYTIYDITSDVNVLIGDDYEPDPVGVTGISLDRSELSLNIGETQKLVATVSPDDAADKSIVWSSGNESVATVDQDGNVTGVSAGTATIYVTTADGSHVAMCTVTVKAAPAGITTSVEKDGNAVTVSMTAYDDSEAVYVSIYVTFEDGSFMKVVAKLTYDGSEASLSATFSSNCGAVAYLVSVYDGNPLYGSGVMMTASSGSTVI